MFPFSDDLGGGGPIFTESCNDITTWTDGDGGDAASTQVTFDGKGTFKFDSGTSAGAGAALRTRAPIVIPDKCTLTVRIQNDLLGTIADTDYFRFQFQDAANSLMLEVRIGSDGVFIFDGTTSNEVGTNINTLDQWDVYQFAIDFPDSKCADVLLNGVSQGTDFALRSTSQGANEINIQQFGATTDGMISYVDYLTVE